MVDTKQVNVRLPQRTQEQIRKLKVLTGMTITQIMVLAIEQLYQEECKNAVDERQ